MDRRIFDEVVCIFHDDAGECCIRACGAVRRAALRFFVVFEPDIGRNLAGFAERWGEDYNRNGLQGIRAMVFCNGWYANQVSNLEPRMLALCPLHLSVYRQGELTHVVFVRPAVVGKDSKAAALLQELESDVSKAIAQGVSAAAVRP
jgi:hypothetical protein